MSRTGAAITEDEVEALTTEALKEQELLAKYGYTLEELKDAALDHNVEKCPNCGWWGESSVMIPTDEGDPDFGEVDGYCDNCRIEKKGKSKVRGVRE